MQITGIPQICIIFASEILIMKHLILLIGFLLVLLGAQAFPASDTVKIPFSRIGFHDKVDKEQQLLDKADGEQDKMLHAGKNEEINLQLTDVLYRKTDELQLWIETNKAIASNNDKVRYLRYLENMLREFRAGWYNKFIKPVEFAAYFATFESIIKGLPNGSSMLPALAEASHPVSKIITDVFADNTDNTEAQKIVYLKYVTLHPDNILKTIRPFTQASFADSLVVVACKNNPVQLYSYAQSSGSPEGKLIHRNSNNMVKVVAQLSQTPNALLYFPFLDDLLSGKNTVENIRKYVGDANGGYDSLGYYGLLVNTEIAYFKRMAPPLRDTPIAMFGSNSLRDVLKEKAIRHFITPINELHDNSNLAIRMKAIQPLNAQQLYYMLIMGESDIYTSSYKHSFARLLQLLGPQPRGDSLLQLVHFDYFKKFIKMAANFNALDTFLKTMPSANSEILMKAFVANLDKTGNLEDAVDVADSYSSITNKKLLNTILTYVKENEQKSTYENNTRGKLVYGLLKTIFLSADTSNKIDLTVTVGIPSIYEIAHKELEDAKGRIVQQVFFYGDEDGKAFFPSFVNSFSPKDWTVTYKKEWVEIKSNKADVWVFANRPLDFDQNLDDSAQVHLTRYMESNQMHPSVVVHRGHSYWLPGTIARMPDNAKVVILGSCGGYQNLDKILEVSPDAHIISTKEIGKGDINTPIFNYLNQSFISGNTLYWRDMWKSLGVFFGRDPSREVRESWENYIPPYRNLGAIFIKAYHKQTSNNEGS